MVGYSCCGIIFNELNDAIDYASKVYRISGLLVAVLMVTIS